MKSKKLSYTGEEIAQPHPLTPNQIVKGLPPVGHGGSIPILPFLKGRTRFLLENPEESLLNESERGMAPSTARVHIVKGFELEVFNLLQQRGIVDWFPDEDVFADSRGQYLSGMFGVIKQGKFTSVNKPVLRCIMNLIPINGLFTVLRGDIHCLPSATSWMTMVIAEGETLAMSQGDMHAAFYLFQLPSCWNRYMCFNYKLKGAVLGKTGMEADKWFRPTCKVLPMGWSSSVGIMQAISREILLCRGLPPHLEVRRGSSLPSWFAQVINKQSETQAWWQIYLDNFMSGERTEQSGG